MHAERTEHGFEVVSFESSEVIHFVPCEFVGSMRHRVLVGLMRNMDLDRYFVRDTRDMEPGAEIDRDRELARRERETR
jgi:hypothetical protein